MTASVQVLKEIADAIADNTRSIRELINLLRSVTAETDYMINGKPRTVIRTGTIPLFRGNRRRPVRTVRFSEEE
jgi:hypothetical protein